MSNWLKFHAMKISQITLLSLLMIIGQSFVFGTNVDPIKMPPTITCPSNITVACNAIPATFTEFEEFEDAGGTASAGIDTFYFKSESNPSTCVLSRQYEVREGNLFANCTYNITITGDNNNPVARCKPFEARLGGTTGQITIIPQLNLNNGSTDDCGIRAYASSVSFIACNDIGTVVPYFLTVTDNCGKTNTCSSTITVTSCPKDTMISLSNTCTIVVPNLAANINTFMPCIQRPVTIVTQNPMPGTILPSSHGTLHPVTFQISNGAGLMETCSINIIAQDRMNPFITCRTTIATAIADNVLRPDTMFNVVTDNCAINALRYDIRRNGTECGTTTQDDFGPYASFCCQDIGQTRSVIVRVTDANGNTATCLRNVRVIDNTIPTITAGSLPDITISCSFPLNLTNSSAFGTLVSLGSTRNNIVIADPGNPFYPTGIAGQDGYYYSCDGGTVSVTSRVQLNSCSQGQILRDFVVTDLSGNRSTYTQTIFVRDVQPFKETDITWPAKDVSFESCSSVTPNPTVTGRPILRNDKCSRADATYKDQKFTINICGFIKRTWTVIDWCQYKTNDPNSKGIYTFVQNITYKNSTAPTFTGKTCRDTSVCVGANCQAPVSFSASGNDDCQPVYVTYSYKMDLGNNNTTDNSGNTNNYSGTLPVGTHALTWTIKDRCNNSRSCKSTITVRDCTPPLLVAKAGIAANINPSFGNVTLWAKDLVYSGTDNCTAIAAIRYSFSSNVNLTSRVFTCADRGTRPVDLWATDLAGNQTKVTVMVNIQDTNKFCGTATDGNKDEKEIVTQRSVNQENTLIFGEASPNPYNNEVSVKINSSHATYINITMWGEDGRIIQTKTVNLVVGEQTLILDDQGKKLPSGTYFFKLSNQDVEKVLRVIKQ
jgi:hypothetical protein